MGATRGRGEGRLRGVRGGRKQAWGKIGGMWVWYNWKTPGIFKQRVV